MKNAPIVEAVLQISVRPNSAISTEKMKDFASRASASLPIMRERHRFTTAVSISKGKADRQDKDELYAYQFRDQEDSRVLALRADSMSFSRLKPYTHWDEFVAEARHWWSLYRGFADPEDVTRLGLRYVNRISLPYSGERLQFKDYLTCAVPVPPELPQHVSTFLTQFTIHEPEKGIAARVTQALEEAEANAVPVLLDIDVFRKVDFGVDDEQIWSIFGLLRELKNRVFFACITEKTVGLFT
ncbi:MAG TPA: TIGR04255 family protein [Verrucomicrobia bacterium]|nr:TIGR04255 family protein [Verrucomicrobiota bacterium]